MHLDNPENIECKNQVQTYKYIHTTSIDDAHNITNAPSSLLEFSMKYHRQ